MMPSPTPATALRVACTVEESALWGETAVALQARGLACEQMPLPQAVAAAARVVAFAPARLPSLSETAGIARLCAHAASAGAPVIMLYTAAAAPGAAAITQAATLAYLRAHGAIICRDPDVWLEALVLVSCHGLPGGPRVALVAPPGTWMAAKAAALASELQAQGVRFPLVARSAGKLGATDVALVDRSALAADAPTRVAGALVVPVASRAEFQDPQGPVALVGLRSALAAAAAAGDAAERIAAGTGPAPIADGAQLAPDLERFERQLGKLGERAGDHETKVLLASYGVPVTRQAVATTPSAATRIAKKAGFPVEVKPWDPECPSELEGCPVERDLHTAAEVRRAYVAVGNALDLPAGAPVIVRARPPHGRELWVQFVRLEALDWMTLVRIAGAPRPIAAPAPLRPIDAEEIARHVETSREGDLDIDREALADLLVRASHLAADHGDVFEQIELSRVIATPAGERPVVVDARARLHPR